jgi:hypothetical protein
VPAGCWLASYPTWFSQPGLSSSPLLVNVAWERQGCSLPSGFTYTQESPKTATSDVGDVARVDMTSQLVQSYNPGLAKLTVGYDSFTCGTFLAIVDPELAGPWDATCDNGDTGGVDITLEYPESPTVFTMSRPDPLDGWAPPQAIFGLIGSAVSCFSGAGGYSCSGGPPVASAVSFLSLAPFTQTDGQCTASTPCTALTLEECGSARHGTPGSTLTGATTFREGTCNYTKATTSKCQGPGCSSVAGALNADAVDAGCSGYFYFCPGDAGELCSIRPGYPAADPDPAACCSGVEMFCASLHPEGGVVSTFNCDWDPALSLNSDIPPGCAVVPDTFGDGGVCQFTSGGACCPPSFVPPH